MKAASPRTGESAALLLKHGAKKGKELRSTGDALKESIFDTLRKVNGY